MILYKYSIKFFFYNIGDGRGILVHPGKRILSDPKFNNYFMLYSKK